MHRRSYRNSDRFCDQLEKTHLQGDPEMHGIRYPNQHRRRKKRQTKGSEHSRKKPFNSIGETARRKMVLALQYQMKEHNLTMNRLAQRVGINTDILEQWLEDSGDEMDDMDIEFIENRIVKWAAQSNKKSMSDVGEKDDSPDSHSSSLSRKMRKIEQALNSKEYFNKTFDETMSNEESKSWSLLLRENPKPKIVDTGMLLLERRGNDEQPYKIVRRLNMQVATELKRDIGKGDCSSSCSSSQHKYNDRENVDDMTNISDDDEQQQCVAEDKLEDGEGYVDERNPERKKYTRSILVSSAMARHEDRMERVARRMKLVEELNLKLRSEQQRNRINQFRTPTRPRLGQRKRRRNMKKKGHDEKEAETSSSITRKTGHRIRKRKSYQSKLEKQDFNNNFQEDSSENFDFFKDENSLDQNYNLETNDIQDAYVHRGRKGSDLHRKKILNRLKLAQKLIEKLRKRRMSITKTQ